MSDEHNGSEGAAPAQQALCAEHPDQAAVGTCARCGNFYCNACAGRRDGPRGFCRRCHAEQAYVAWEDRSLSLWQRYYRTVRSSLVEMPKFAAELPAEGGVASPLSFALLGTGASVLIATSLLSVFAGLMVGSFSPPGEQALPAGAMIAIVFVAYGAMGIGGHLAYVALWPAILLGTARMLGNRELRYEGLFRVLCYACGLNCFYFVPLLGMAVVGYHIVLSAMGIAAQGRTSVGMGFAIYGLPALVFGGCCCGGYVAMIMLTMQGRP